MGRKSREELYDASSEHTTQVKSYMMSNGSNKRERERDW